MLELLAWFGTCCLAIHMAPQVIKSWREQDASGLSVTMLGTWLLGIVCTLPYVISVMNWPVVAAHSINFVACSTLLFIKFKTTRNN